MKGKKGNAKENITYLEVEKYFFFPDIHFPFHDEKALNSAYNFCNDFNPNTIVQLGDLLDCYALSDYSKDPTRLLSMQTEIDHGRNFFKKLRQMCPDAEIHYKEGNHEERFQRVLFSKPELFPLKALALENLLGLDEYQVQFTRASQQLIFHDTLMVTHGKYVRGNPGYSACAELGARGYSGVSGHVHRAAKVNLPKAKKDYTWVESGYLGSKMDGFEFMGDVDPNWKHAVTVGYMYNYGDDNWQVRLDLVEADQNGNFFYGGKFYTPNGVVTYV